jgi:hypothetical protein
MPTRDLWHLGFVRLVKQRRPPNFEVRSEVPLSDEPQRADLILLRREDMPARDDEAQVLRGLWRHLPAYALVEFKSPVKEFRTTDLMKLASYGAQLHVLEHERIWAPADLTLVLVIPCRNAALGEEIARMGWRLTPLGGGYGRIDGGVYTVILVETDEVSEEERDDYLRIFSHHECKTDEAVWWWEQWTAEDETMQDLKTLEGYKEMRKKFARSLTVEERVEDLTPEQRLAGLPPEQQILALSDEVLRGFADDYLRSLPPDVQDAIRKRIGRPSA